MYAAMALVSACWGVKAGNHAGRVIDVDLVTSVFSLMEGMLPEYGLFGSVRQPQGAAIKTAAPTKAPAGGGGGPAEARALMRGGKFTPAANAFAAHLKSMGPSFTIQLFVACSEETVKKAADNVPQDELYIVPVVLKGRSCYRIGWGVYDGEARAGAALKSLPAYFNQPGVTPRVVQTSTVLQ